MLRLVIYFIAVAGIASILSWLADNPGSIVVNWQGYIWDTDVFQVAILLSFVVVCAVFAWTVLRSVWQSPATMRSFITHRREKRGLEALSSGLIAIGAGDRALARRYANQARTSLPNEPMTHLLRAQAAQLAGDRTTSRRIFEAMLAAPDTEALGLRGLFLEAEHEGEMEAALQFAARAVKLNPKLSWPVDALFDIQCKSKNWEGALATLAIAKKHGHVEKHAADRRRAVLLAGQAQAAEDNDPERALVLALEAHNLAPGLVPAAAVAGRLLAAKGNTSRATRVLQKTWKKSPHPDLAVAYAHARLGDSPRDRLKRVQELAALTPNMIESPIAVANAALEARAYDVARAELASLVEGRLTQRVCTLMARIEDEDASNTGGVREWLARAVNAPRDPAWTADGIVSETWQPVSPVTGALDAFQWRVPVETAEPCSKEVLSRHIEELVQLGVRPASVIDQPDTSLVDEGQVDKDRADRLAANEDIKAQNQETIHTAAQVDESVDAEIAKVSQPLLTAANTKTNLTEKSDGRLENGAFDPKAEFSAELRKSGENRQQGVSTLSKSNSGSVHVEPSNKPQGKASDVADKSGQSAGEPPQENKAEVRVKKTKSLSADEKNKSLPVEPKIFVPPRAADDPGQDYASKKH